MKRAVIKVSGEAHRGFVVETDAADVENQFGAFNDFSRLFRGQHPRIHPGKLRMAFIDNAFFHRRGSEGTTNRFDRRARFFFVIPDARA